MPPAGSATATIAHPTAEATLAARIVTVVRSETAIVRIALSVVALHVVDDNFLQPAPGTSAADHRASGLTPLAILAAFAALYPRPRPGVRAWTAMTFGALGLVVGGPAVYYLSQGEASGDHYTGLLALLAGAVLLATGPVTLWRTRRAGGRPYL